MSVISFVFYAILLVIALLIIYAHFTRPSHIDTFLRTGNEKFEALYEIQEKPVKTAKDNFIAGMIVGEHVDAGHNVRRTMQHLVGAAQDIIRPQTIDNTINETLIADRLRAARHTDFMARRIGDLHNVAAPHIEDMAVNLALFDIFNEANDVAITRTAEQTMAAAAQAPTRKEALEIVFKPTHTSDSQNVHDSAVLGSTKQIIDKIKTPGMSSRKAIKAARRHCGGYLRGDKLAAAEKVLAEIEKQNGILSLGTSEDDVFAAVWTRADHENNREKAGQIRDAVCDALVDCIDANTNTPVCITGRATRLVGALATLDFDEDTDKVQTFEMRKNEIFNDVKGLIERQIVAQKASANAEMARGAAIYEGMGDSEVSPHGQRNGDVSPHGQRNGDIAAEKRFKEYVREEIDKVVVERAGDMRPADVEQIRQTCLVYAALD